LDGKRGIVGYDSDHHLVARDEFDAVRAMAQKAREENIALEARLAALEAQKKG
jgi:BMFP domain-containing protein YqiC